MDIAHVNHCLFDLYKDLLLHVNSSRLKIDEFRYVKIQFKAIDLSTRVWGTTRVCSEIYCFKLSFNTLKLVYINS